MASIRKEHTVGADPNSAWDALCDYGAVHERVAPGFVTDTTLDGNDRIVTFFNGTQARERLVSIDHERRRLVYTVIDSPLTLSHHQASVEVIDMNGTEGGSRFVWTTDVLPEEVAPVINDLMERGAAVIARALAR